MNSYSLWDRFQKYFLSEPKLGLSLDISRVNLPDTYFPSMLAPMEKAYDAMEALEKGGIANPDEERKVGHYWLRNSVLAPSQEIRCEIEAALESIKKFSASVHSGDIMPQIGGRFAHLLVIGIGGSALGPQFVSHALESTKDPMDLYFFDNTDPDGMEKVLNCLPDLSRTMCIVISKSGGTKETRNGMLIAKHAWTLAGLDFSKAAVAITGSQSELDRVAQEEGWLARFPMWDWVGGRTSELSAVGLLPAALQGFNISEMIRGAREMDEITRRRDSLKNPAALLALMWYFIGNGKGLKDMVVLPYSDRLELLSRYLQQLVMESLGKELDLDGKVVNQGIAVYGNKGSTDQHAYVQQLRDGLSNFFAIFITVNKDKYSRTLTGDSSAILPRQFSASELEVEPGTTCGDYLLGFYLGTRQALYEKARQSISISIQEVNEYSIGLLIALFERAVGFYASLINVNAYHQPGVEAGKKAASYVLTVQRKIVGHLKSAGHACTISEIAKGVGEEEHTETIFHVLTHLASNNRVKVVQDREITEAKYEIVTSRR